jgi:hypothetical protein
MKNRSNSSAEESANVLFKKYSSGEGDMFNPAEEDDEEKESKTKKKKSGKDSNVLVNKLTLDF